MLRFPRTVVSQLSCQRGALLTPLAPLPFVCSAIAVRVVSRARLCGRQQLEGTLEAGVGEQDTLL